MANGHFVNPYPPELFRTPGSADQVLSGIDLAPDKNDLFDALYYATPVGQLDVLQPVAPSPGSSFSGYSLRSYADDYFNRIHFVPVSLDFGAISGEVTKSVSVWNAYLNDAVVLNDTAVPTNSGLIVTQDDEESFPVNFGAMQSKAFTVTATSDGIAVIDGSILWNFDIPFTFDMLVTGTRARLWPYAPAWPPSGRSYQLTYEYSTDILTSRDGSEQRLALRESPRKSLSHQSHMSGEDFNGFKNLLWSWHNRTFVTPELTRFADSSGTMVPGTDSLAFAELPWWAVEEAQVVLVYGEQRAVTVIASISGTTLIFKTKTSAYWPIGTRMHPGLAGYMEQDLQAPRRTNAVATLEVRFNVAPLSEPFVLPPTAPSTFNGRELFMKRPNWANAVAPVMSHEVDEIDFGRGPLARYTAVHYGVEARKATYLNRNYAEAEALLDFFRRMRGRQGEFYMPTWEYDFKPKELALANTSSLLIRGVDIYDAYGSSRVHRAMFVLFNDGTFISRKVTQIDSVVSLDGTDSRITVSTTWGRDLSADSIIMCGWMPVWRLSSDSITFEWLTDSVANVQMTMQTLEDLTV